MKEIKFENITNNELIKIVSSNKKIKFNNCEFIDEIKLNSEIINTNLLFNKCKFNERISFNQTKFKKEVKFYDCKFSEIFFWNTVFKKEINFSLCNPLITSDKNSIVFTFSRFESRFIFIGNKIKNMDFSNSCFNDFSIFDSLQLNKLNLAKSIFNKSPIITNIKGITNKDIKIENIFNRDTARVIKNSLEQQNNIVDANKFYGLEMKKARKELDWKKDFKDWFVFKIHEIASNHSQDWFLCLCWIVLFGMMLSIFKIEIDSLFVCFTVVSIPFLYLKVQKWMFLIFYLLYYLWGFKIHSMTLLLILTLFQL